MAFPILILSSLTNNVDRHVPVALLNWMRANTAWACQFLRRAMNDSSYLDLFLVSEIHPHLPRHLESPRFHQRHPDSMVGVMTLPGWSMTVAEVFPEWFQALRST